MTEFMLGEIVKQSPSVPVEQKPLVPLGGENPPEAGTEAENAYEEMTSFYMLNLLLEGKLPAEAVPFYFQKQRDEEIAVATGALYKRIGTDPVSRKFEAIIKAQHDKI